MIQVNRKTRHYRIYTLLYYTRTREKKQKRKRQREQSTPDEGLKRKKRRKCAGSRRGVIYHVPHPQGKQTITQTADAGGLNVINHDPTRFILFDS